MRGVIRWPHCACPFQAVCANGFAAGAPESSCASGKIPASHGIELQTSDTWSAVSFEAFTEYTDFQVSYFHPNQTYDSAFRQPLLVALVSPTSATCRLSRNTLTLVSIVHAIFFFLAPPFEPWAVVFTTAERDDGIIGACVCACVCSQTCSCRPAALTQAVHTLTRTYVLCALRFCTLAGDCGRWCALAGFLLRDRFSNQTFADLTSDASCESKAGPVKRTHTHTHSLSLSRVFFCSCVRTHSCGPSRGAGHLCP